MAEQDHRFIERRIRLMLGFKAFASATATLASVEAANMICKRQFAAAKLTAFQQFAQPAA